VDSTETNENGRVVRPNNAFIQFRKTDIEQSITARFEQQVALYAERIAISAGEQKTTYRDLNVMANRIAWALLNARGDHPEQIALLLESSEVLIAAILGVLKSNKVYVPLDPSVPQKRNRFISADSEAVLIITNKKHAALATDLSAGSIPLINVDDLDSNGPAKNPEVCVSPDSLAYIIYTSGSTGHPKGVIETHRNLLHNVFRNTNTLHICADDRVTLLRSIGAAGAARDALSALLNGATLCPFSIKEQGLENLAAWIEREEITILTAVVSVFRHLASTISGTDNFCKLRLIFAGGEQVTSNDIDLYQKHFSHRCLFVNRLGITETGTVAYYFIDKETSLSGAIVPVGYDAEDTEVLLLDENEKEVGANVIGEIAVRSKYISPGYWKLPELNESAFLPDPAGGDKRIYLTGDLGRKSTDGCLTHLGWKNLQVNVRGFRVEIAEIETQLLRHPDIKEVAVYGRQHFSGETRLVAAIVAVGNTIVNTQTLRGFLKDRLPDHMHPLVYLWLEKLPLSANGKVDRRALPTPNWVVVQSASDFTAAQTEIELIIVDIWQETLGLDRVGVKDNFFDLGGDSLLLGKIITRLNAVCKVEIPLSGFFVDPTVATLALIIEGALRGGEDAINPIARIPRNGSFPLSFAQEPILMLARLFPALHQFNIPAAYRLRGPLNVVALKQSLMRLIDRHEALRTVFPVENGKHYQSIIESLSINLDVIDLHELPETERESKATELSREESQQPFDLAHGPLFRVKVFRLSVDDHILAVTVHQVISDGWSMMLFFRDLAELYRGSLHAEQSQLPDLPIQYVDFTVWQREALQEGLMDGQLSYWKRQLSEPLTPLEFSTGVRRSDEMSFFTARKRISISGKLFQSVKSLARQEKTTPFMVLLTALNILLSRYLGQDDIRVGTLVANRHRSEVENLIGHCVNTIIVRTRISENLNFKKLAQLIREITVSAHSNQDIPFEVLLQTFENETTIRCDMLSPVLFIFQGEPQPINLPHLTVSVLDEFQNTAAPEVALTMFDLVLSVKERSEGLTGFLVYKMFVFDEMMVNGFIRNFENLLERIAYDPNESVSALSSLVEI